MEKIGYIYKITSPSGKSYIGQTIHFEKRMRAHSSSKGGTKLSNSIKSYGWDNHSVEILCQGLFTEEGLNQLEIHYIRVYNSFQGGLNLTQGGGGARGRIPSEETKGKISVARKGRPKSEETKAKISTAKRGRKLSEEAIAKRSATRKGRPVAQETRARISAAKKGKPKSEETRSRISAANRGKTFSEETRAKLSAASREAWKLRKEGKFLNKS